MPRHIVIYSTMSQIMQLQLTLRISPNTTSEREALKICELEL